MDIDIYESFLYNKLKVNFLKFANIEKKDSDDFLFTNLLKFDEDLHKKITILPSTFWKKDIYSIKLGKLENDIEFKANKKTYG